MIGQPCPFAPANGLTLLKAWRNLSPHAIAGSHNQLFYENERLI
jgi:hypothetical protein